jgi:hypothetical protein
MVVGKGYRVDAHVELASDWPYAADSYVIGTVLSSWSWTTGPASVHIYVLNNTTAMTLNRDGSCTTVQFGLEPKTPGEHQMTLVLFSQGGVPLAQYPLPTVVELPETAPPAELETA